MKEAISKWKKLDIKTIFETVSFCVSFHFFYWGNFFVIL